MLPTPMVDKKDLLTYEIHSSWWAGRIGNKYLQRLSGKYFAWKVNRKYANYMKSLLRRDYLRSLNVI